MAGTWMPPASSCRPRNCTREAIRDRSLTGLRGKRFARVGAPAARAPAFQVLPFPASFPHMKSEWLRVGPETIYWVPRLAAKIWNIDTIYISENGTSAADEPASDGNIYDLDRIMYLR